MSAKPDYTSRLAALRLAMKAKKLDGFLVPRADAWQGEYIAPCDARLAWISGFTGSAGLALVTHKQAVLFTDGRYTLQAAREVDGRLFTIEQAPPVEPFGWISKNMKGKRIGFDPSLHTSLAIASMKRGGAVPVPCASNLIDKVWNTRPPRKKAGIIIQPSRYAGEAATAKRKRMATQLKDEGIDAFLITRPDSISWLLNLRSDAIPHTPYILAHAILHKNSKVDLFAPLAEFSPKLRQHLGNGVSLENPAALLPRLRELKASRVSLAMDASHAPHLLAATSSAKARAGGDPCQMAKACKNASEIKGSRRAHEMDGAALVKFLHWLERTSAKQAIDEMMVVKQLAQYRRENRHCRDLSFDTIAGAGANGAVIHYRVDEASNRTIKRGDLLLVDSGGQYFHGTTDITRTMAIGRPPPEAKKHFTYVLKGHIALARARFPEGTSGAQLDMLARQYLWAAGLDYAHGTGHGVGSYLSVHEGPQNISPRGATGLRAGMIISNEPGYYKEGSYGIRIENLVLVKPPALAKGGEQKMLSFETLSLAPIDTSLIERSLISPDERNWLNDYHAEVRTRLTPLLGTSDAAWLKRATKKL